MKCFFRLKFTPFDIKRRKRSVFLKELFRRIIFLCYFVIEYRRIQNNNNINMKNYLGIVLIVLGALVLLVSYFAEWVDYNPVQFTGLGLIIAGLIAHILITKRMK